MLLFKIAIRNAVKYLIQKLEEIFQNRVKIGEVFTLLINIYL